MPDTFRKQYRPLSDGEKATMDLIKTHAEGLLEVLNRLPRSREQSLAVTNLEQAVMWAVKGLTG